MIKKISVENFYSIHEPVEVSFVVDKNAPDTSGYVQTKNNGDRLTKLAMFIGPNASGKTNIFKALSFLTWFIVQSIDTKSGEEIPFSPFLFSSSTVSLPTKFSIQFFITNDEYEYSLYVVKERVVFEQLKKRINKKLSILFTRKYDAHTQRYLFNQRNKFNLSSNIKNLVRENTSVITVAAQFNHSESRRIVGYFENMVSNISKDGHVSMENFAKGRIIRLYHEQPNLKKHAEELLRKFDTGLNSVEIQFEKKKNNKGEDEESWHVQGFHAGDGKSKYGLQFHLESQGTQDLFTALALLLPILQHGGVAILDELQNSIHPHIMSEILSLFSSQKYNPQNAQLIWTSHGVEIMNELDKQQIFFVEKNDLGCTDVWRLDDMEGVNNRDNFFAKYLSGAYGAVPRLHKS